MSCNGCRVLRKGCNENCILRQSLRCIETPQAQSNATLFVAKFFGRAALMSFLSSVADSQRPALFQSLLFEACGRIVNPVNGAVGLLWTGNWNVCQSAVDTVLLGGVLRPIPEFSGLSPVDEIDDAFVTNKIDLSGSEDILPPTADLWRGKRRRAETPNSEESETTTFESGNLIEQGRSEAKLLRLFV